MAPSAKTAITQWARPLAAARIDLTDGTRADLGPAYNAPCVLDRP